MLRLQLPVASPILRIRSNVLLKNRNLSYHDQESNPCTVGVVVLGVTWLAYINSCRCTRSGRFVARFAVLAALLSCFVLDSSIIEKYNMEIFSL